MTDETPITLADHNAQFDFDLVIAPDKFGHMVAEAHLTKVPLMLLPEALRYVGTAEFIDGLADRLEAHITARVEGAAE